MEDSGVPGLYIHIPFCISRCSYCDFFSVTDTGLIDRFLDALLSEMDAYRPDFAAFDTVYIGGGTPSALPVSRIGLLLEKVCRTFAIQRDAEITIEVNPADWQRNDLEQLRGLGFNRISIGVQSLDNDELALLGRRHSAEQALNAIEDAIRAGFDNISVDLIYGLPGQGLDGWLETLREAVRYRPSHLSCYELEVKPGTPLSLRYESGEFLSLSEESLRDFFMLTSGFLEDAGYCHYEVSNFASGMERASRHNRKYWDHTPYLGLGPSAHSFNHCRRWWNHESVTGYCRDLEQNKRPVAGSELLDSEQLRLEALFLGLRMRKGIDLEHYHSRYGYDLMKERGPVLKEWEDTGLIEIQDGVIRPTRAGMAVADSLALL